MRLRSFETIWRRSAAVPALATQSGVTEPLKRSTGGIQYVHHHEGNGEKLFEAACKLELEGIVSKRLSAPYKWDLVKSWIKVRESEFAGVSADHGRDVLRVLGDLVTIL